MEVQTCTRCRRFFNYIGGERICPACKEEVEKEFQKVKDYIRENKGATVIQVAEECEVSEKQIREWVREERLELTATDGAFVCEKCGVAITSGRFCAKCKADMVDTLNSAIKKDEPKPEPKKNNRDGNKMRFL